MPVVGYKDKHLVWATSNGFPRDWLIPIGLGIKLPQNNCACVQCVLNAVYHEAIFTTTV